MEPNQKKSLLELKNDLDGTNRITAKLLRDFLVSAFGSRWVSRISDSSDLGADEDIAVIEMTESGNYVRLPDSKDSDTSETPYEFKRYTLYNASTDYSFRLITQADDRFKSDDENLLQEIIIEPKQVWEIFAYEERWFAYFSGNVPDDITGKSEIFSRFSTVIGPQNNLVVDRIKNSDSVKWLIRCEDAVGKKYRASEIMFTKMDTDGESVEYAVVGDYDMGVEFSVSVNGDGEIELKGVNSLQNETKIKVLRYEIG